MNKKALTDQPRIVAKVEQRMALRDALKTRHATSHAAANLLSDFAAEPTAA